MFKFVTDKYDYKRKRINIFGFSFKFKTKEWDKYGDQFNIEKNTANLAFDLPNSDKNILFVASDFAISGGVETRLVQYIEKLTARGWNCYILSENNPCKELQQYTNFILNFEAENVSECINQIIERYKIKTVEFQFKGTHILKNIDINNLKSKVNLGCVIHGIGIGDLDLLNQFHYKIVVSEFLYQNHYSCLDNVVVIRNSIDTAKHKLNNLWSYKGQKKALLISRIAKDKLPSIECFIKYCRSHNIEFMIAGDYSSNNIKNKLIKNFKLKPDIFIGKINTLEYLEQNLDNILFVGGCGLVILESAYTNCPCFCCSKYEGEDYSFITKDNIHLFDNFTIRKASLVAQEGKKEYDLNLNNILHYQNHEYIKTKRDITSCVEKYVDIIEKEKSSI